jgi:hypothetical protein
MITIELITADGVAHDLDACIDRGVDGIPGLLAVPEKRGRDLVVPQSHGELHLPGKKYGANTIVLRPWVRGVTPDGTIPEAGDGRLVFHQNLRHLLALFTVDEQVTLRLTLEDGTAREITGEVLDAIPPDIEGRDRDTVGRLNVALRCAFPFWSDLDDTEVVVIAGAPQTLTEFAGADAPMEDLLVEFDPQSNPRLEQTSTGIWVQVNRVILPGQTITVDSATWQVYGSPGVAPGLYEDLAYGGRGTTRWFALRPEPGGGPPVVELTQTGPGAGSATVTGKRRFKIA